MSFASVISFEGILLISCYVRFKILGIKANLGLGLYYYKIDMC